MTGASKCLWEKLGLRPKPCAPRAKTFLGRKVLDSKELYPKNAILFLQSFFEGEREREMSLTVTMLCYAKRRDDGV